MIAKHVPMRSAQKSDFAELVNYITDAQGKEHRLGNVRITNCQTQNLKAAMAEVLATQFGNTRASNDKTYHLLVSFRAGESPPEEVLHQIEDRICEGIGFAGHQRISAVHNDTDNLHVHIAINKIHPKRNTINEPFRAYKMLANLCESLELEFGLERDNHKKAISLSEGLANDMEHHSGIESLVSWIRKECLSELRSASSWQELHNLMAENGLRLRERGAGLIIESGEICVKASTVARDLSKGALEDRLGPFLNADGKGKSSQKRSYSKKPILKKINTTELYAKYKDTQKTLAAARTAELKRLRSRKEHALASVKRSNKLRRASIKIADSRGINKKHLYAQAYSTFKSAVEEISQQFKTDKDKTYKKYRSLTWADWLKQQAQSGDDVALQALRARDGSQSLKENIISLQSGEGYTAKSSLEVDSITKKGTVIYRAGKSAVRDDGKHIQVSNGADINAVEAALKLSIEKYGTNLKIGGSAEFKAQVIHIVKKSSLPITFTDAALEKLKQQHINGEITNANVQRRRPNRGGASGSRAGTTNHRRGGSGRGAHKPDLERIGRKPPPQSKNRLRGLSELGVVRLSERGEVLLSGNVSRNLEQPGAKRTDGMRRDVSGARSGVSSSQDKAAARKKGRGL